MKVQITFFDKNNKCKPIARLVEVESLEEYNNNKAKYQQQAILSICHKMHIVPADFKAIGYTKVKADSVENIELQKRIRQIKRLAEKRQQQKIWQQVKSFDKINKKIIK